MMEYVGCMTGASRSFDGSRMIITFEVEKCAEHQIMDMKKQDKLTIRVVKYKKKRSLDANAYAWVLMSKIADAVDTSKDEVYEEMLQKYGCYYEDEDGVIVGTFPEHVDVSKIEGHWKRYKKNGKFVSYLMIKGSSEYDTSEMSHFVERIVEEARELGIETMTPNEIARLTQEWTL